MFNPIQQKILREYQNGEFAYLCEPAATEEDLKNCGDGLLVFVIREISGREGCESVNEAYERIDCAADDLHDILEIIADWKENG